MRIRYWSSDVCSSDLRDQHGIGVTRTARLDTELDRAGQAVDRRLILDHLVPARREIEPGAGDDRDALPERHPFQRGDDMEGKRMAEIILFELVGVAEPLRTARSEEHTSELQSLMSISYAVFCLKKK